MSSFLFVVDKDVALGSNTSDQTLAAILTDAGHTVTYISEADTPPTSGYDAVIITESGSGSAVAPYDTNPMPVGCFDVSWDDLRLATAASTVAAATNSVQPQSSHPSMTGLASPLEIFTSTSTGNARSVELTAMATGVDIVALVDSDTSRAHCIAADSGATLTSGTAPNRRFGIGIVESRVLLLNANGEQYTLQVCEWLAGTSAGIEHDVAVTDAMGLTDSKSLQVGIGQTDNLGLTDTKSLGLAYSYLDPMDLSDQVLKTRGEADTDAMGLTDEILVRLVKSRENIDNLGITDTIQFARSLGHTDLTGLVDSVALARTLVMSNNVGLTDDVTVTVSEIISILNNVGLTDEVDVNHIIPPPVADIGDELSMVDEKRAIAQTHLSLTDAQVAAMSSNDLFHAYWASRSLLEPGNTQVLSIYDHFKDASPDGEHWIRDIEAVV